MLLFEFVSKSTSPNRSSCHDLSQSEVAHDSEFKHRVETRTLRPLALDRRFLCCTLRELPTRIGEAALRVGAGSTGSHFGKRPVGG